VVTIVGEAGIGKTRLIRELLLPLHDETRILVGRCVSYGEGATYLPIAEAVRQAAREPSLAGIAALLEGEDDGDQVARRVAELAGLGAEAAAPGEASWAVRRFIEALAHELPVVLVLDDIHWAEPTLLDLVEYLGEWTAAPVLVLCAARSELLETRPAWGGPTSTGFVVELGPLASEEIGRLVHELTAEPVDATVGERIVEQAGGNPLFAEQLVAAATETRGLAVEQTPASMEALLASRLDRLDPRGLTVLRRASVLGRRFTLDELDDLTPPEAAATLRPDLLELVDRGLFFARDRVLTFHHVLVRDVAYGGLPKAERADLHERAAHGLDRRKGADELIGYHFEQAHLYVAELDLDGNRAQELAAAGGEHLGRAGIRAWQRADVPAAINLLRRALALTPDAHDLACELGLALNVQGDRSEAIQVFNAVIDRAIGHYKLRAEVERAVLESLQGPHRAGPLLEIATRAVPVLEAARDDRALGRAWYGIAHVRGGFYCQYAAMEEAAENNAACYRRSGWPLSSPVELLGLALEFGPRPVDDAITRLIDVAAEDTSRWMNANVFVWLGRLEAMRANFDIARAHVDRARAAFNELGLVGAFADQSPRAVAAVELAAGNAEAAERELRGACEYLEQRRETAVLATRAAELANVLYVAGRYEEAADLVRIARDSGGDDDLDAALTRRPVEAMLRAREGHIEDAERIARATVELATTTDSPIFRAAALLALAEVLDLAGAPQAANEHVDAALVLYEQKGNTAAAARVRAKYEEPRMGLLVPDEHSA
jgi:tetratricopeptide (TPR) repeat protein